MKITIKDIKEVPFDENTPPPAHTPGQGGTIGEMVREEKLSTPYEPTNDSIPPEEERGHP